LEIQFWDVTKLNSSELSLLFTYPYVNPAYGPSFRSAHLFFGAVCLFALLIYCLSWDDLSHQEIGVLLLGFLGLLICNPLGWIESTSPDLSQFVDRLLAALFVGYFRYFAYDRIRLILNPKQSFITIALFLALAAGDFFCHFEPDHALTLSTNPTSWRLPTPILGRAIVLGVYALLVISLWIRVCSREQELPHESNRTFCFGSVQVLAFLAAVLQDLVAELFASVALSPAPELLYLAAHHVGAAVCIIWSREFHQEKVPDRFQSRFFLDSD
jgi:hypothetical protein